ncbi:unnamed protein product [Adineta steineri]|uniref:TIR domain-containing protein n=1 Tax=Adineta steineri TaxID=433720 RepID=A0A819FQZ3_9BILA|nr:unnamed protein product [Adineta steineri]
MALSDGKHVMLSYNWKSQKIVSRVYDILKAENIPVWFDVQGGMKDDIYKSMAEGVENAAIVCCFMTPEYQESENCQLELTYAEKQHKRIIACLIDEKKNWRPSNWLGLITAKLLYVHFKDDSEEGIQIKTKELIDRIKEHSASAESIYYEAGHGCETDECTEHCRLHKHRLSKPIHTHPHHAHTLPVHPHHKYPHTPIHHYPHSHSK